MQACAKLWLIGRRMIIVLTSFGLWKVRFEFFGLSGIYYKKKSSGVQIHYSASEISSGSLDIHSKRSDHWRHYIPKEWK